MAEKMVREEIAERRRRMKREWRSKNESGWWRSEVMVEEMETKEGEGKR